MKYYFKTLQIKVLIILIFIIIAQIISSQELKTNQKLFIRHFIESIKRNDKKEISLMISYPLMRENPIPPIMNKQEFLKRYNEIFDYNLKLLICNSNINSDWTVIGYQGISYGNGDIWFDFDGKLITLNYISLAERIKKDHIIQVIKKQIHSSLSNFIQPLHIMETQKFRIRIDDMGNSKYRYASWSINKKMTEKPDLIIENGIVDFEGNGGNQSYIFNNSGYKYKCSIITIGEADSPPAILSISKDDVEILNQKAKIIY